MNAASTRLPVPPVVPPYPLWLDGRWIGAMPLRDFLEIDAEATAAGSARRHLAAVLAEWGLGDLRDSAGLVLSELITNSVAATNAAAWTRGKPPVRLWLRGDAARVGLIVWDAVTSVPVPRDADIEDESGRGLAIVAALSAEWGHYLPGVPFGGKVTWALVSDP